MPQPICVVNQQGSQAQQTRDVQNSLAYGQQNSPYSQGYIHSGDGRPAMVFSGGQPGNPPPYQQTLPQASQSGYQQTYLPTVPMAPQQGYAQSSEQAPQMVPQQVIQQIFFADTKLYSDTSANFSISAKPSIELTANLPTRV